MNIIFTPGEEFENLISQAEFNVVASRIAQSATLKTEKAGGGTVDLEAARAAVKKGNSSSGSTDSTEDGPSGQPSQG